MCKSILKARTQQESVLCNKDCPPECSAKRYHRSSKVKFGQVELREYPIILDETQTGSPYLTVDWESNTSRTTTVGQHEVFGKTGEAVRQITSQDRILILLNAGYDNEFLRQHLSKPCPGEEQDTEEPRRPKKTIFSKMKLFKKKVAMATAAA